MSEYSNDFYMQLNRTSQATIFAMTIGAKAVIGLMQFLMRLHREGILSGGEVERFEQFVKATEGRYEIYSVPLLQGQEQETLESIKAKLDTLKVRYHVLPNVSANDQIESICIFKDDIPKFQQFFSGYIQENLSGGEKKVDDLRNFTGGKTSIVSVPEVSLEKLEEAMDTLQVDYAYLPDLNLKDGEKQFIISTSSEQNMKEVYRLYREGLAKRGQEIADMKIMKSPEEYQDTAKITEDDYRKGAVGKAKEANDKYAGEDIKIKDRIFLYHENDIRPSGCHACGEYLNNDNFLKLSIDDATLVHQDTDPVPEQLMTRFPENFYCRIPGTYGKDEQILQVPKKQVFEVNDADRRRYLVFVNKEEQPTVLSPRGRKYTEYKKGEDLFSRFDGSRRHTANRPAAQPSRNRFNNFEGHNYDFEALEAKLLSGNGIDTVAANIPKPPMVK